MNPADIPKEKKLKKYIGDHKKLEDWIADGERAVVVKGQQATDAVDFLIYHQEGAVGDEVRLRPATEWATPEGLACEQTLLGRRTGKERRKEGLKRKVHKKPFLLRSDEEKFPLAEICCGIKIRPPTSSIIFSAKLPS